MKMAPTHPNKSLNLYRRNGRTVMALRWTRPDKAHMDWPFIENANNFIIDYHIVHAVVCVYLIAYRAGHVWGLDGWVEKLSFWSSVLRPRARKRRPCAPQ